MKEESFHVGKFLSLDKAGGQMGVHRYRNSLSLKLVQFIIQRLCLMES